MLCSVAGLLVEMTCGGRTARSAEPYRVQSDRTPDIRLSVSQEDIARFRAEHPDARILDWEYMLLCGKFCFELLRFNGFVLHASAVAKDGRAYLFSADPGVGKSTHTALWCSLYPDARILNDDKPALRLTENGFYACGTPWSGKSDLNLPLCMPLGALCFLERSDRNTIRRLDDPAEILPLLFAQTTRRMGSARTDKLLFLLGKLIEEVPIYRLRCLPNEDAARLAYETMKPQA
ncbi:MAG: hypothetical protein J6X30_02875 [Clostridia bacterium]|nr:hypothetical protein [Clostridia bacterium]